MPLGVNDITLAEITTAYQTLLTGKIFKCKDANWTEACFIKEIKNRDGRTIFRNKMESMTVLDDTVTTQMGVMLRSVFTNGTAHSQLTALSVKNPEGASKLRYPVMGKTGTTNDTFDVWIDGFTPDYAAALWIGTDLNVEMNGSSDQAAALWSRIMSQVNGI